MLVDLWYRLQMQDPIYMRLGQTGVRVAMGTPDTIDMQLPATMEGTDLKHLRANPGQHELSAIMVKDHKRRRPLPPQTSNNDMHRASGAPDVPNVPRGSAADILPGRPENREGDLTALRGIYQGLPDLRMPGKQGGPARCDALLCKGARPLCDSSNQTSTCPDYRCS